MDRFGPGYFDWIWHLVHHIHAIFGVYLYAYPCRTIWYNHTGTPCQMMHLCYIVYHPLCHARMQTAWIWILMPLNFSNATPGPTSACAPTGYKFIHKLEYMFPCWISWQHHSLRCDFEKNKSCVALLDLSCRRLCCKSTSNWSLEACIWRATTKYVFVLKVSSEREKR